MTDHSVFKLAQPGTFCDPLTEVLRTGARALLAAAIAAAALLGRLPEDDRAIATEGFGMVIQDMVRMEMVHEEPPGDSAKTTFQ